MSKAVINFLQITLLLCIAVTSTAQTNTETETKAVAQADADLVAEGKAVLALVASLEQGISELKVLDGQINTVPEMDREALFYRRDERSFALLQDMDEIARQVVELPEGDAVRVEVERRLSEDLNQASDAVIQRIDELGTRIVDHTKGLDGLSGGQHIAQEAYIHSLEALRVQYYEALASVIEGREALGMQTEALSQRLRPVLYLHAETLVGHIEFGAFALKELKERLDGDPQNADLSATIKDLSSRQQIYLNRLDSIVGVLGRLGLEESAYKATLLKQGQGLSVKDFEGAVAANLLRDGWSALREGMVEKAPDLLFDLVIFILVLLAFRALSRLTRRAVSAACDRPGVDISSLLKDILASVSGGTVMVIGVLMALSQVGISLGPMLAGLGVAGFVVGFALQDSLSNFAAGGMILIYRPYDVDDFVEIAGAAGLVKKMSLVSTTIATFDNQTLVVPNSKIWGDVIKNVTAQKVRRVDLEFGIGYSDDVEHAERVLEDILDKNEMVLKKPEPMIKLHALADSSVNFAVRPWVKTDDYWDVYWDITREVKMRFDREGISIPFPQRDVHMFTEES
ncbi:MAG: mechanosensitive ion channel family protein [Gammaproteobacteria bacterium]|jgi:small conductance mechanosensitive channel|nr:mechanosensitive ion channel family protein [Gammaproteobacteria bacterium]